jgi:hypothetical protein
MNIAATFLRTRTISSFLVGEIMFDLRVFYMRDRFKERKCCVHWNVAVQHNST